MAKVTAKQVQQNLEEERRSRPGGFISAVKNMFLGVDTDMEEYSMEERRKVIAYLDTSFQKLCTIFRIDPGPGMDFVDSRTALQSPPRETIPRENTVTSESSPLPLQPNLRSRKRYCDTKYEGDPEMAPVMTVEVGFLVRALRFVSSKINESYGDKINVLYCQDNLKGRLARQVLSPPVIVRSGESEKEPGSRHNYVRMPPRLSLRSLANRAILVKMMFIIFILSWVMRCGYLQATSVFLFSWFMWLLTKALLAPVVGCGVPVVPSPTYSSSSVLCSL